MILDASSYVAKSTASVYPLTVSQLVNWSSSDETIATVDENGLVYFMVNSLYDFVDLGLPSGTLWKTKNEPSLYTYDKSVTKLNLPSSFIYN